MDQAKKLSEAKRKLAKMQAEVEQLQKACEDTQGLHYQTPHHAQAETSRQAETHNLHQASLSHQEQTSISIITKQTHPLTQPLHSQQCCS
jgi:hypothetical protein